jgi:hypothetical protein
MRLLLLSFLFPIFCFSQDSLFLSSEVPGSHFNEPDKPVELGVRFSIENGGHITAIKWYASASGQYVANLYQGEQKIFSTPFAASSRGWVLIPVDILLIAGEYTASVFAPNGRYGSRNNVFNTVRTRGNLSAPISAGKYTYNATSAFPTEVYRNSSYYVDIVFKEEEKTIVKSISDTVTLSLDTCGSVPSVSYILKAEGSASFSYTWEEAGEPTNTFSGQSVSITFKDDGQRMFVATGKDAAGNIRSVTTILVTIVGNPKDVVIELLRDGTFRVRGTNILLTYPYTIENDL